MTTLEYVQSFNLILTPGDKKITKLAIVYDSKFEIYQF